MSSLTVNTIHSITKILNQNINNYNVFIESGTFGGETTSNLVNSFQVLHTIELSEKYYNHFNNIKIQNNYNNVVNHFGDTVQVLPEILKNLNQYDKSIFWLDGHWSSLDTAKGSKDCPLIEECVSIDNLYKSNKAIILIDDYRLFGTNYAEDWTNITEENILKCFKNHKVIEKFIKDDIFILYIEK